MVRYSKNNIKIKKTTGLTKHKPYSSYNSNTRISMEGGGCERNFITQEQREQSQDKLNNLLGRSPNVNTKTKIV